MSVEVYKEKNIILALQQVKGINKNKRQEGIKTKNKYTCIKTRDSSKTIYKISYFIKSKKIPWMVHYKKTKQLI